MDRLSFVRMVACMWQRVGLHRGALETAPVDEWRTKSLGQTDDFEGLPPWAETGHLPLDLAGHWEHTPPVNSVTCEARARVAIEWVPSSGRVDPLDLSRWFGEIRVPQAATGRVLTYQGVPWVECSVECVETTGLLRVEVVPGWFCLTRDMAMQVLEWLPAEDESDDQ